MRADISKTSLETVQSLLDANRLVEADTALRTYIGGLSTVIVREREPELRTLIARFYHKRKRDLTAVLDDRVGLARPSATKEGGTGRQGHAVDLTALSHDWHNLLDTLSAYHIFQWSSYYRDACERIYRAALDSSDDVAPTDPVAATLQAEFERHSAEIFGKGFSHVTQSLQMRPDVARAKSLGGLQRFLELPVERYSALSFEVRTASSARSLRRITSAILAGILAGYASVDYGGSTGWDSLERFRTSWLHVLAFVTGDDCRRLAAGHSGAEQALWQVLAQTYLPIAEAVDRLMQHRQGSEICMPRVSQFLTDPDRLEFSLVVPHGSQPFLQLCCVIQEGRLSRSMTEDLVRRGHHLAAADIDDESRAWLAQLDLPPLALIDTGADSAYGADAEHSAVERAFAVLQATVDSGATTSATAPTPLTHNYARDFPLEDPHRRRYFLVQRNSVRRLLEEFESQTGVRLWCSVRRSGKTTACRDLATVAGRTAVVIQTMDTSLQPELNLFYQRVQEALDAESRLRPDFLQGVVKECSVATAPIAVAFGKTVLVLDEYETLFGELASAARADDLLRYRVVQPLLSQLANFAQENLLILVGQKPDAHYILMDQNQLSPLVRQDAFPLFQHALGDTSTEFSQYLRRVLTEKVVFDASFADAVFEETAGHPYLTVNVLVDFFQWLIDSHRSSGELNFSVRDFVTFRRERLGAAALRQSTNYGFFQNMLREGLSELSREKTPWLFAVMTAIKCIADEEPKALMCSVPRFKALVQPVCAQFGWNEDDLLRTASLSNFITVRGGKVGPAIRILGRLANITQATSN